MVNYFLTALVEGFTPPPSRPAASRADWLTNAAYRETDG
jgi:hypothetical protein